MALTKFPSWSVKTRKNPYSCSIGTKTSKPHGWAAQTSVSVKLSEKSKVPRSGGAAPAWAPRHSADTPNTAQTVTNLGSEPAVRLMFRPLAHESPRLANTQHGSKRLDVRRRTATAPATLCRRGKERQPSAHRRR